MIYKDTQTLQKFVLKKVQKYIKKNFHAGKKSHARYFSI